MPTVDQWYQVYRGQQIALEAIAKDVAKLAAAGAAGGGGAGDGTIPFLRLIADNIADLTVQMAAGAKLLGIDPASGLTKINERIASADVDITAALVGPAGLVSDDILDRGDSVAGAIDRVAAAINPDPAGAAAAHEAALLIAKVLEPFARPGSLTPAELWANAAKNVEAIGAGTKSFLELFNPAPAVKTLSEKLVSPVIVGAAALAKTIMEPLQGPFRTVLQVGFDEMRTSIEAAHSDPKNGPIQVALAGILAAHRLGQAAHGLAATIELHPLFHQLGFSHMAAAVVDISGFKPLSDAAMRPYIEAAIARPMRYTTNEQFVPNIPGENALADHVRRRTLDLDVYGRWLAKLGYDYEHRKRMIETVWRDPTIRDLALALEDAKIDEEWLLRRVRTAGYDNEDADQITRGLLQRANKASRERLRASAAGAYAEGTISGEEYETLLADVGLSADAVRWERRAAELQRRRDAVKDAIATYRRQYTSDQITRDDYALALTALGVDPERLAALLADADSTRAPRVQREEEAQVAAALSELRRELVPRYRRLYELGQVGAEEYQRMLEQAGIAPAVAAQAVSLDAARLRAAAAATGSAAAERQLAELLRERQDLAVQQYRRGLLTDDQLAAALLAANRPPDQIDIVVAQERLLRLPITSRPPPIAKEAVDRLTPEFTRQAAILDFRAGLLTPDELVVALLATGYTTPQAEAATDYELARLPAPKT
jgi:hypothetical protein